MEEYTQPDNNLSREELMEELSIAQQQANFWFLVVTAAAQRNHNSNYEEGSRRDILQSMVRYAIHDGLLHRIFTPDIMSSKLPGLDEKETEQIKDEWQGGIPWSVVQDLCDLLEIEYDDVLDNVLRESQEAVMRTAVIRGDDIPMPKFDLSEGAPEGFTAVRIGDLPSDVAEQLFAQLHKNSDDYILEVEHDDHPCRHGYATLEMAIQMAAHDEMTGRIQRAIKITHRGDVAVDEQTLRNHIDQIKAAPSN